MENTLRLTVKKYWFDMIKSGVKKEEYREIKPYWHKRLVQEMQEFRREETESFSEYDLMVYYMPVFKKYSEAEFKNGYSKDAPMVRVKVNNIRIGKPKVEWCIDEIDFDGDSLDFHDCFIIELGDIVAS